VVLHVTVHHRYHLASHSFEHSGPYPPRNLARPQPSFNPLLLFLCIHAVDSLLQLPPNMAPMCAQHHDEAAGDKKEEQHSTSRKNCNSPPPTKRLLADYDDEGIYVYQAFTPP
jgi:hypothetical protein